MASASDPMRRLRNLILASLALVSGRKMHCDDSRVDIIKSLGHYGRWSKVEAL